MELTKGQNIRFLATGNCWSFKFKRGDDLVFRDEDGYLTSQDKEWIKHMINTKKAELL